MSKLNYLYLKDNENNLNNLNQQYIYNLKKFNICHEIF